jgi:hypothetical protein
LNDPNKQSGSSPTRKTVPPSTDFSLENHGSIFLLRPQTVSARVWIDDHIGKDNGYQPYYPTVVVEHRYISDIVKGIRNDGLAVM